MVSSADRRNGRRRPGRCPDCRRRAARVHSMYQRRVTERPMGSHRVLVRLRVRRFFCDRKSCHAGRSPSRSTG
ncbi:transposase family protein [Streptomyces sp. NBC_00322]|uniref:transposase family protein n=1 Tax=Streptomyces sp. NBC_00322 TaxID=2975712 RepID=UPI003FA7A1AC